VTQRRPWIRFSSKAVTPPARSKAGKTVWPKKPRGPDAPADLSLYRVFEGSNLALGRAEERLSEEENMAEPYAYRRLEKNDAVVLLVDHQSGLISLVQDYPPNEFKNNVLALAACAKFFALPTILTTSFEDGPNGPLVPELKEMFPDAPYIPRPGQINAWDNPDFVEAIRKTGRKQLILAGVVTDVCVAFVALSAREAGYEVFAVTDASGTFDLGVRTAALMRMQAAGVQLVNWFAVACELHRDWRNDVEGLGALLSNHIPNYRNLMTSYFVRERARV
jgi:nicotinamidase-related amidase